MKRIIKDSYLYVVLICFGIGLFVSCSHKTKAEISPLILEPQMVQTTEKNQNSIIKKPGRNFQSVHVGGTVVLLLGYGYNSEDVILDVKDEIKKNFGLSEEDGSLYCLQFPGDFMVGSNGSISLLSKKLENRDIAALLILGAPPGTHKQLAELQDEDCSYPVFSLFSQDDILGTEAGSTIVFDIPSSRNNMFSEEETVVFEGDICDVILPLIAGVLQGWKSFRNNDYRLYVSDQILSNSGYTVVQYIDPETGIKSENHYILIQKGY
ncbi:MAG: hypothetical protein BKP49_03075 [Treponema sp. CETP13]|nr:MAG: hypothetical protein BKP49_03075 [Treponema sp. CETP13]